MATRVAKKKTAAPSRKVSAKSRTPKKTPKAKAAPSSKASSHRSIRSRITAAHKRRAEIWMQGDVEGYLSYYWDDAILVVDGSTITIPDFRQWLHHTLSAGGGSLAFHLPRLDNIAISPLGDAVTTIFPWSQRFQTAEGEVSDRQNFETNVWYQSDGVWKIIRLHLTTINKTLISAEQHQYSATG